MFRIAILSFWHVHAKDYASQAQEHPQAEIVAVWDEDERRGRVEAEKRRGVRFDESLEGVLARDDVDGVVVTTPTTAHHEVIPAAARARKHVFTEKVIAPTLREARDVVRETEEAGVTFLVALPRLYAGYTRTIRAVMADGRIGEPTYLRVRVSHDGALPSMANPRGWLPQRFFDPADSAGGVTIDFGAHPLYLAAYLLGVPQEVRATYGHFTGRDVEDNSVVTLLYPKGAVAVAEASLLGACWPFSVEAHGTEGSLLYDPEGGLRMRRLGETGWETIRLASDGPSPFRRWVELASRHQTDSENVRTALTLSALTEAANLSSAEGRPVQPGEPSW